MTDEICRAIYEEVEPLCKTATVGDNSETTTLYDWLYEGWYRGDETPEGIAQEWYELSDAIPEEDWLSDILENIWKVRGDL